VTEDTNILKHYLVTFIFVFSVWLEIDRPVAKFCSLSRAILITGWPDAVERLYRNMDISKFSQLSPELWSIKIWLYTVSSCYTQSCRYNSDISLVSSVQWNLYLFCAPSCAEYCRQTFMSCKQLAQQEIKLTIIAKPCSY